MALSKTHAQDRAIEIIKAALASGAIKLQGSHSGDWNKPHIDADSEYLSGVLNALTATIYEGARREQD